MLGALLLYINIGAYIVRVNKRMYSKMRARLPEGNCGVLHAGVRELHAV